MKSTPEYQKATTENIQKQAEVKAVAKTQVSSLRGKFQARSISAITEKDKASQLINKIETNRRKNETLNTSVDSFNKALSAKDIDTADASKNLKVLKVMETHSKTMNTSRLQPLCDLQTGICHLPESAKQQLAEQAIHESDAEDTKQALETTEAILEKEELKTALTWKGRKKAYEEARTHLSQIYQITPDPQTGEKQLLGEKQFEAVMATMMDNETVKKAIQSELKNENPKVQGLYEDYQKSVVSGEGNAYLLLQQTL